MQALSLLSSDNHACLATDTCVQGYCLHGKKTYQWKKRVFWHWTPSKKRTPKSRWLRARVGKALTISSTSPCLFCGVSPAGNDCVRTWTSGNEAYERTPVRKMVCCCCFPRIDQPRDFSVKTPILSVPEVDSKTGSGYKASHDLEFSVAHDEENHCALLRTTIAPEESHDTLPRLIDTAPSTDNVALMIIID